MGRSVLFKIPLPFTVEDYARASLYTTAEITRKETGKGSGIEVIEVRDREYELPDFTKVTSEYSHKIYHMERMVPKFLKSVGQKLYGPEIFKFLEDSYNCYPYMYTASENKHKADRFRSVIISNHFDNDDGSLQQPPLIYNNPYLNVVGKPYEKLSVHVLDISLPIEKDPNFKYDPTRTPAPKMGIPTLPMSTPECPWWRNKNYKGPIMCAYKFSYVDANFFPMSSSIEKYFIKMQKVSFLRMHKQMYCYLDDWGPMTMEDVKEFDKKIGLMTKELLHRQDVVFEYEAVEDDEKNGALGADAKSNNGSSCNESSDSRKSKT